MTMLSGVAEPLLDGFAATGISLLYSTATVHSPKSSSGVSMDVTRVAGSSHREPTDPFGIGDQ
jgi:hypothetical protein